PPPPPPPGAGSYGDSALNSEPRMPAESLAPWAVILPIDCTVTVIEAAGDRSARSAAGRMEAAAEAAVVADGGLLASLGSNAAEQSELRQGGDPVIAADLLDDLAVPELEDGHAGEVHLPAGLGRQAAGEEVLEGGPGVGPAALPLADD